METATKQKWYEKTWLVILLLIVFFPVGLYALWKNTSISKPWKIIVTVFFAILVIYQIGRDKEPNLSKNNTAVSKNSTEEHQSGNNAQIDKKSDEQKVISKGDVLHTKYFDVIVNKAELSNGVKTGNQFADIKPEKDNNFLILNVSFKNTDNESRTIFGAGTIWINYNGKDYEYDKDETVLLEGWGMILEKFNPLTSKTTNLVFKIPSEIKGPAYYQPGRSSKDERIFLGNL